MRIARIEIKRRVWIGLGFAVAVTGAWWIQVRMRPPVETVAARPKQPFVLLAKTGPNSGDQVLREQAELMDAMPLFFPTEWNYGQRPLGEGMLKQPGQVFGSFEPRLPMSQNGIALYHGETASAPEKLSDLLAQGNEAPFAAMGQVDMQRSRLAERSSFVEVRSLVGGKGIINQPLNGLILPRLDFAPLEFLVVVSSAGVIGDPVLMSGSGWEEVDAFFRSYLVKSFHLGERLNPGRYRVLVGP